MIKFKNESDFLAHFCKKGESVTLDATNLQRYMINTENLKREIRKQYKVIEDLKCKLSLKTEIITSLELEKSPTYFLDLSV